MERSTETDKQMARGRMGLMKSCDSNEPQSASAVSNRRIDTELSIGDILVFSLGIAL